MPTIEKLNEKVAIVRQTDSEKAIGGDAGIGGGGELTSLDFKARLVDELSSVPKDDSPLDITAGKTDTGLYAAQYGYFRISYDAAKTVNVTGVNAVMSLAPSFVVKEGDILVVGNVARKIVTVTDQTNYVLEAALISNVVDSACCVSQGIHTKDMNNFDADGSGLAVSSQFSDDVDSVMVGYWDTEVDQDVIPNFGTLPVIGFSVSADGFAWGEKQTRRQSLDEELQTVGCPVSGSSFYVRFFANKTSGSGQVNLLQYKTYWHKELSELSGQDFFTAFARPAANVEQDCVHSVVGGKSRFKFSFSYGRGMSDGRVVGSALTVKADGKELPRYIAGVTDPSQGYFIELDDTTIEMDADYSLAPVDFQFKVPVLVIDTRTENTSRIANLEDYAGESFQDYVIEKKVDVPYTSIQNRAQISDLSQDLRPRMGVERIVTQSIYEIQDEFGANGEPVRGLVGDERVRFVGGSWVDSTNVNGSTSIATVIGDYVEITFYGTGLNLLCHFDADNRDFRASIDGEAYGSNISPQGGSAVLKNRNYASNVIIPVNATTLTLGIHTIKVKLNGGDLILSVFGLEVLNESTQITIPAGSAFINKKLINMSPKQLVDYNTGFESGVLGINGGHAVTYLKEDGSVGKAVTPTDAVALYLGATDHSNEEISRKYNWREFGAGRDDDFSSLTTTAADKAFTLDDNSTTLVVKQGYNWAEYLSCWYTTANFFTITFIGTGLDVFAKRDLLQRGFSIEVDGIPKGSYVLSDGIIGRLGICSGLPYGTHTVKFTNTEAGDVAIGVRDFIVYQPKKPSIPTTALELGEYNILADFVANTVQGADTISTGSVRKSSSREFIYGDTWTYGGIDPASINGREVTTTVAGSFLEYSFFGSGFDFRWNSGNYSLQFTLDDSTNFSPFTTSHYTNGTETWDESTGAMSTGNAVGLNQGLVVSGLSLGVHKIKVLMVATGGQAFRPFAFDIITPIYFPKQNKNPVQGAIEVGNNSLGDSRKLKAVEEKEINASKAIKVNAVASVSVAVYVPIPNMSIIMKTKQGRITIGLFIINNMTAATTAYYSLYVDGKEVLYAYKHHNAGDVGSNKPTYITTDVDVSEGTHIIQGYWKAAVGTLASTVRELTVREL